MSDMSATIVPKSDQINADDLIAGPRTIRISAVAVRPGTEQPVSVSIDGDQKVFRPCKSMCRVMVAAWGIDSSTYVGKSMTLYRDPKVKWGGLEIGGIRISHMSGMDGPLKLALSESKAVRKPYTVQPLKVDAPAAPAAAEDKAGAWLATFRAEVAGAVNRDALAAVQTRAAKALDKLAGQFPDLHRQATDALGERLEALTDDADPFATPATLFLDGASETLVLTVNEMRAIPTEDALDAWLKRNEASHAEMFDEEDRDLLERAVAERRKAWG